MAQKDKTTTPLMKQYNEIKAKYPDFILLFRVGDFYETFGQDAVETSKILNIVLTKRGTVNADYLAGFPYHALETYLPRFVRAGKRVAICEQVEDPKTAKGIVKRSVEEIVTPAISYTDMEIQTDNSFLCAIHKNKDNFGIAFVDVNTGDFFVSEGNANDMEKLLQNFTPKEIVLQRQKERELQNILPKNILTKTYDDWVFSLDFAQGVLEDSFGVNSVKGFGIEDMPLAITAAGATLYYIKETNHNELSHICNIARIDNGKFVWMDKFTIKNLEILHSFNSEQSTLYYTLNKTQTNMGARQLQRWLMLPLKDKQAIEQRQKLVTCLIYNDDLRENMQNALQEIGDMERIISRLSVHRINPQELFHFTNILKSIHELKNKISLLEKDKELFPVLDDCYKMREYIIKSINADAPNNINKGNVIKYGFSEELDRYKDITTNSQAVLDKICSEQASNTGISSLRIGFNNVFGYYLEVTNTHKDKVPCNWERKQTLANAERYITPELKEIESQMLAAQENISSLETRLYHEVIEECKTYMQSLHNTAKELAKLDVLLSFAIVALENRYTRPEIMQNDILHISAGRHPVIEKMLSQGEEYVANDVYLDTTTQQIIIITGPNMSGKSAYLRQTALIVIMAQIGSYVPAKHAQIGIVDKIFTRVGASDNIASGESTFMVEMNETASILNNVSSHSLVLLDEIGRGTSTYDGVSIAWGIADYLHNHKYRAKVLFATHYHELIAMENHFERIKNYHITVKELGSKILFIRKIARGGSSKSFGLHVARLAGMPKPVLNVAEKMLQRLEEKRSDTLQLDIQKNDKKGYQKDKNTTKDEVLSGFQTSFIQLNDPLLEQIKEEILNTDIENLTPINALNKLNEIKAIVEKK